MTEAEATVAADASGKYHLILAAVRCDQLTAACAGLAALAGEPAVVFFGNNPAGRSAITGRVPGAVYLGFPGIGGVMAGGTAYYARIRQRRDVRPQPRREPHRLGAAHAPSGSGRTPRGCSWPVPRRDLDGNLDLPLRRWASPV